MTTAIGSYATGTALKQVAGITDTTDDTLLGLICDRINDFIEGRTHRVLAPIGTATYYYDGDGSRSLYLPVTSRGEHIGGIRAVITLQAQQYTGAGYEDIDSSQYFLRQPVGTRGPFERLIFTDYPTGGYSHWPRGFETVKITATAGWTAIPDEISDIALTAATRAWFARQSGQQDVAGTDAMGAPIVSRFFSAKDLETLNRYGTDIPG